MAVTNRNSALYTSVYVNKYLADARDVYGSARFIPFLHTIGSGEIGGASAGVRDTVNLCEIPANCMVVGLEFKANALWGSAGTNGTLQLGDSGDDDRYMVATELYSAESPLPTEGTVRFGLAFAGQNYKTDSATVVKAEYRGANPVVGKVFKGGFWVVPVG